MPGPAAMAHVCTGRLAGSDEGGTNWAIIASLIETCKLNGVNPQAWLTDTRRLHARRNRGPSQEEDQSQSVTVHNHSLARRVQAESHVLRFGRTCRSPRL
jgi:hypothetical protein